MLSYSDFLADRNGVELNRLAALYDFPDFVKQASLDQLRAPERLGPATCADPIGGHFNCDTRAATWLSALYYFDKKAEYQPNQQRQLEQRLEHFADYWGIRPAYDKVAAEAILVNKKAAERDEDFAYVKLDPVGGMVRLLPIKDASSVKRAAAWLSENRDSLTFMERNGIAERVLERAASFSAALGVELDEFLEKQAGRGVCDPTEIVGLLKNRARLAKDSGTRDGITKLASMIEADARRFCHPDNLVKLAETIDTIDRGLGLVGNYSDGVPRPEDVLFAVTFTKAAAMVTEKVALTTGTVYDKRTLAKVALHDVRGLFGDEFASQVSKGLNVDPEKLAELASTLPRPDAVMFDSLMSENGLHPTLMKSASDVRIGMSDAELLAWAGAYVG